MDLAPKVSGRVTILKVKEGDSVTAGQVIAELDGVEFAEQLGRGQSQSLQQALSSRVQSAQAQFVPGAGAIYSHR